MKWVCFAHCAWSRTFPHIRFSIVREFCEEKGIPYHETGLIQSWREALGELHRNGEPLRNPEPAEAR